MGGRGRAAPVPGHQREGCREQGSSLRDLEGVWGRGRWLFSASTLSAPGKAEPLEKQSGNSGRNPKLRPLSNCPISGREPRGHTVKSLGGTSDSSRGLPETFPPKPPHAPRGGIVAPTVLAAFGAPCLVASHPPQPLELWLPPPRAASPASALCVLCPPSVMPSPSAWRDTWPI